MGVIVKLEGKYFEFSTIVDAPITYPCTLKQFVKHWLYEYGHCYSTRSNLRQSLELVKVKGVSSRLSRNAENFLSINHAGKDGTSLSFEQFKSWARGEVKETQELIGKSFKELEED